MNHVAFTLFNDLRTIHPGALGNFKGAFISTPNASAGEIVMLENGWGLQPACDLIYYFANFLRDSIYNNAGWNPGGITSPPVLPKYGKDQWHDIKSVIDRFDVAISQLPIS
ncbi:hypothetical protein CTheo_8662 [Ceratobasidium theobromae]|uniref:Uncharacterized protein n=1 Tax=Ceratobasidium theobromae TaxID=1582974 RepID=A0A5N5Q919_9AGAM|nr:hypothetical protein CTheo_8662 [Ceratobasidium theobromae]